MEVIREDMVTDKEGWKGKIRVTGPISLRDKELNLI